MTEAAGHAGGQLRGQAAQGSAPAKDECQGPADVGTIHHDEDQDIVYECVFDPRRRIYTWTIVPPVD